MGSSLVGQQLVGEGSCVRTGSPYLYSLKNWVTCSPSEAQGTWKLQLHLSSQQVMAASVLPGTKQHWKAHSSLPQWAGSGSALLAPCLQAGHRLGALLDHILPAKQTRLLPVPEALWSCWKQAFVPELVERLLFLF